MSITRPVNGARYQHGQLITASYRCQDGSGGSGIAACAGTTANGNAIDTATAGRHRFTVTATSKDGQTASASITYTVLLPARVRIIRWRATPLRRGCATETGQREREITAVIADATCRHLRLQLDGAIKLGGVTADAAGGSVQVKVSVHLPRGPATRSAHATVVHGRWQISLVLPAINLDRDPPSYLIIARYNGDDTTQAATTQRRVRLESERAGL